MNDTTVCSVGSLCIQYFLMVSISKRMCDLGVAEGCWYSGYGGIEIDGEQP